MDKLEVNQEKVHQILFSREIGWQEIIYDLINTEQLDPWDIDISFLAYKYLQRVRELEEADFFISSKVIFAASFLIRMKCDILANTHIKSIDEILFGKKEKIPIKLERIDLNENIPELVPRSPIPRLKKVTLQELMESLNKAIITENRRIKKEIIKFRAFHESEISIPRGITTIRNRIKNLFSKLLSHFKNLPQQKRVNYNVISGENKEEVIHSFVPLLHLEHQKKIWLEQKEHFGEIHIWERKNFLEVNGDPFADLRETDNKEEISSDEEGWEDLEKEEKIQE